MRVRIHSQHCKFLAGGKPYLYRLYPILVSIVWVMTTNAQTTTPPPTSQDFLQQLLQQSTASQCESLLKSTPVLLLPPLWRQLLDTAAAAYYNQGSAQAIAIYQIALEVAERLPHQRAAAITYYNLGRTYSGAGKIKEAITAYEASRKAFAGTEFQRDLLYIFSDLGALYLNLEQYELAKQYAEQTLASAEDLQLKAAPAGLWPDEFGIAGAWSLMGALDRREGKYEQAIANLKQAQSLYQQLDRGGSKFDYQIADALAEIGRVYNDAGDNVQALTFLQQALQVANKPPSIELAASIRNSLGVLYLEQEDYEQAKTQLRQSLQGYGHNQAEAARVLLNLGVIEQRRSNFAPALHYFQQALQQATSAGKQDVMMAAGEGLGVIHREQGNFPAAFQVLAESLSQARALQDKMREAEILWRIAETHQARGAFTQAVELSRQAHQIAVQQHLPKLSYLTAVTLGQAYFSQKKIPQALEMLTAATDQLEALRTHVAGQEQERQLFFVNKVTAYHLLTELQLMQGKSFEALLAVERAKARVLLDSLQRGQSQPKEELFAAQKLPLLSQYDLRECITPKTAVLEYLVTKEKTFLFVIRKKTLTSEPEIQTFTINLSAQELQKRTSTFQQMIASRRPAFAAEARDLYRLLLQPAAALLQGVDSLCIIPDGSLWEVPFQALQDATGRYVLEEYAIHFAPSLNVLSAMRQPPAQQISPSLLALGNPAHKETKTDSAEKFSREFAPLPDAEKEVASVGKLFGKRKVLTGQAATESIFKSLAGDYGMLHLATHAVLDNLHPLNSYLLLANSQSDEKNDGLLTAREVMELKLQAQLVVLSACETANGRISAGEGVIGLSWAFLLAGCRTMVVSQWQVNSTSTTEFMIHFFTQLKRGEDKKQGAKAQALRQATLQLLHQSRYQHPYYWAGFVMIGE